MANGSLLGITENIHQIALSWFDDEGGRIDGLVPLAEEFADRMLAGGLVYSGGDPGFSDELHHRAGCFAFIKTWNGQKLGPNDVLLMGRLSQLDTSTRIFRPVNLVQARGTISSALTIYVGSHKWPQISSLMPACSPRWGNRLKFVDTGAPRGSAWADIAVGQAATVAIAFALMGEVVAVLSRKGRTAAVLGSVMAPGGKAWNEKLGVTEPFVADISIAPIQAGKLGNEYFAGCRRQIESFMGTGAADRVRLGARRLVDCLKRDGVTWAITDGHIHSRGGLVPRGLTNLVMYGPSWDWIAPTGLKRGDTLLYMGYIVYPQASVDTAEDAGADAVVFSCEPGRPSGNVTHILSCWDKWDAVVALPGYPYRALPSSGVVTTLQWYSLMAEVEAIISK